MKASGLLLGGLLALCAGEARAQVESATPLSNESPRTSAFEIKLGGYKPLIDREAALKGQNPFNSIFGATAMLLFEAEVERELWQQFGTASVGLSVGYAERYAPAQIVDSATSVVQDSAERTGFFSLPIRAMGIYRLDYGALHLGIPLVPYVKVGLVYNPWWTTKGGSIEYVNGARGAGGKWGYTFTVGGSFLLDVLEPRFARDFDSDLGINHTYAFAEYTYADVNNFGAAGLDLSSRHWMFGLAFEL